MVHYLCSLKCDPGKVFRTSSFFNIKSSNANKTLPQILLNTNNINNIYQIFKPSNNLRPQHFTFTVRKTFPSTILFYLFFLTKIHIHFPIFVLVLTSNPFPFYYLTNTWPVLTSTSCSNSHTKIFTYYSWNHVHSRECYFLMAPLRGLCVNFFESKSSLFLGILCLCNSIISSNYSHLMKSSIELPSLSAIYEIGLDNSNTTACSFY